MMPPSTKVNPLSLHDALPISKHEYNQNRGNTNLIVFRDDGWPYEGSSNTLALTTVTYNLDTGEIYDADMRSEEHTSELQSQFQLLCRPLLEKKKTRPRDRAPL